MIKTLFLLLSLIFFPLSIILSLFIPHLWLVGLSLYLVSAVIIARDFFTHSPNAAKLVYDPVQTIGFLLLVLFWGYDFYVSFMRFILRPLLPKKDFPSMDSFESN